MVNMVKWSRELQDSPITIETDSLPTVNAIHKGGVNHLDLGHIVQQCREILVSRDDLSVVFAKKQTMSPVEWLGYLVRSIAAIFLLSPQSLLEMIMYDLSSI